MSVDPRTVECASRSDDDSPSAFGPGAPRQPPQPVEAIARAVDFTHPVDARRDVSLECG
jgi:hypothetical protein